MKRKLLLLILALGSARCNLSVAIDESTLVSNLRFAPSAFDSFRRNTELKYTLKVPSNVDLYVVKKDSLRRSLLVKTLASNLAETKGSHSITWLGDTDQRFFAPSGVYYGVIHIRERNYETIVQVFHF